MKNNCFVACNAAIVKTLTNKFMPNRANLLGRIFTKWLACLMLTACTLVQADEVAHPVNPYPYELLPSADLTYDVSVKLYGIPVGGTAIMNWRADGNRYSLKSETRSSLFGKVVEAQSEGLIDAYGLAPVEMTEKRFKKSPYSARFDRQAKTISFTASKKTYPILGGEQDRNSVIFQLAAVVHGMSGIIPKGTEWTFFVVGRRNAMPWTFQTVGMEKIKTGMGAVSALHVKRLQPKGARKQQIDVWLEPTLDGYPVRVVFKEKRQRIEQVLKKIEKMQAKEAE